MKVDSITIIISPTTSDELGGDGNVFDVVDFDVPLIHDLVPPKSVETNDDEEDKEDECAFHKFPRSSWKIYNGQEKDWALTKNDID